MSIHDDLPTIVSQADVDEVLDPQYHVGDRVTFTNVGHESTGIIRSFQFQDWSDEPLAIIDIDPPLPGAVGRSMSRRVEQRHITGRAR